MSRLNTNHKGIGYQIEPISPQDVIDHIVDKIPNSIMSGINKAVLTNYRHGYSRFTLQDVIDKLPEQDEVEVVNVDDRYVIDYEGGNVSLHYLIKTVFMAVGWDVEYKNGEFEICDAIGLLQRKKAMGK